MKKGFTLLEMMIVLSVIALLFLLTLPHIQQKQDIIEKKGCEALIEVVNAQILLFEIANAQTPSSIQELIAGNYLKSSQATCPDGSHIDIVDGEAIHE
ncbi:MAG: competence type IV pilus major pilin ComGC [Erysipelotrichaceae bacterium]